MNKLKTILTICLLGMLLTNGLAQQLQISNLTTHPSRFNDAREPTELDVNFQISDESLLNIVEVTVASDMQKTESQVVTLNLGEWRLWTRGDLKVVVCRLIIPEALVGNCHYAEVKAIDTSAGEVLLEGHPF